MFSLVAGILTLDAMRMLKAADSEDYEKLRAALIHARKSRNITQSRLAERLGERQQLISKYEMGERRLDVIEFVIVVRAIGCDIQEILREISIAE